MLKHLLSVRGKILAVISLLTTLIAGVLFVFITSSQGAADTAAVIDAAGQIRTFSVNVDLLSREITTTSTNNQNLILAIESVLKDDVKFMESIIRFFEGSEFVSQEEFTAFMPFLNIEFRSNRTEFPEILAVAYAPAIAQPDRESFEASIKTNGNPNFQIWDWTSDKQQISAKPREIYFPVNYLVPFEPNRATSFGVDLGSNAEILRVLLEARVTGAVQLLASSPFSISHSEREHTVWIISPIFGKKVSENQQKSLQGYLILSIDVETLLKVSTTRLAQSGVVLQITDTTDAIQTYPVFQNSRLSLTASSGLITASFPINILGRKWIITLPQRIDVNASLKRLSEIATELDERTTLLQNVIASVGFSGVDRSLNTTISLAYEKVVERNKTLQKNLQTFLKARDNNEREGLLPALQNNAFAVFESSTSFVDSLEKALKARVEQSIQISLVVATLAAIIIVAGLLVVRQIIRNLSLVNKTALSLAEGNLDVRTKVETKDEIGQIGNSMDLMANQLQEIINTLEQRVTERTRDLEVARKRAEQANELKSQFLAAMSHELRTPLNGVLNFTTFVADGIFGSVNEKQRDTLKKAIENGEHLLSLINDVLDISKIEAGSLKLFIEDGIDLRQEIETAAATAENLLQDKPVALIRDIAEGLPPIRGDKRRIRQIILNMVSNACKFTDEGSVTIRAYQLDSEIRVSVEDTGPGIAPEDEAAVFESFRQTEAGLRSGKGTGLGMPISRRLAEAHGGRLWLESEPGKGATFFVALPMKQERLELTLRQV
jgi:signal transduction histidine kinase